MKPNQIAGLQAFARYMVDAALEGGDVDGGTIQEIAHQYGLLTKREMKGPCREPEEGYCACAFESGFPVECYQPTDALIAKSAPAEPVSREAVEVVGYMSCDGLDNGLIRRTSYKTYTVPVMTVAQHNRIMAALSPPSPDAELVELLQDASQWFADRDIDINLARDIDAKLASLKP